MAGTGLSVAMMMKAARRGDTIRNIYWQRMRILGQALTLSIFSLNFVLPYLTDQMILFRDMKLVAVRTDAKA
jgi:hypothetical protein